MDTQDRWYVRFRGHTLGPLTSEQVKASVKRRELGPDDKLASMGDPAWRPLRSVADFLRCWESLRRPIPIELSPLPPPQILWKKKRAAAAAPAPEPVVSATSVTSTTPAPVKAPIKKASAKKKKSRPRKTKTPAPPAEAPREAQLPSAPTLQPAPTLLTEKPPAIAAPAIPSPQLADEALSLLEALRDWNRREERVAAAIPARPAEVPRAPELPEPVREPRRSDEIRLNLTLSKQFIVITSLVAALALAAIIFSFVNLEKMRGPADLRLPDPSSPTVEPSAENDPIPQLKAPTRPNRD